MFCGLGISPYYYEFVWRVSSEGRTVIYSAPPSFLALTQGFWSKITVVVMNIIMESLSFVANLNPTNHIATAKPPASLSKFPLPGYRITPDNTVPDLSQ